MGQTVFVTGDAPPLGAWQVDQAMQLVTSPDKYPMWFSASPVQLSVGRTVSYKYMLFSGGDFERWENLDGSRNFTPRGKVKRSGPYFSERVEKNASSDRLIVYSFLYLNFKVAGASMLIRDRFDTVQASIDGHNPSMASSSSVVKQALPGNDRDQLFGVAATVESRNAGTTVPPELPSVFQSQSGSIVAASSATSEMKPGYFSTAGGPPQHSGWSQLATPAEQRLLDVDSTRASSGGLESARASHSGLLRPGPGLIAGHGENRFVETVPHSWSEAHLGTGVPVTMHSEAGLASSMQSAVTAATQGSSPDLGPGPEKASQGPSNSRDASRHGAQGAPSKSKRHQDRERPTNSEDDEVDLQLKPGEGVLIVQQELPVRLSRSDEGDWVATVDEDNLLASKQKSASSSSGLRLAWVGLPVSDDAILPEDRDAVIAALKPHNCHPVFVEYEMQQQCLHGFCNDTLWPCFHNVVDVYGEIPTRWWNRDTQTGRWQSYTAFNRLFTQRIVEVYCPGDLVWIHGISLLLLPSFLKRRLRSASSIGLFLHTPFPSSEVFRTLSVRGEILRGMLAADHVGFHLYEYARHFMAACRRVLGLEHSVQEKGRLAVSYQGRTVLVTLCHAGVEPDLIRYKLALPWIVDAKKGYRNYFAQEGHSQRRPQAWQPAHGMHPMGSVASDDSGAAPAPKKTAIVPGVIIESLGVLTEQPRTLAFTDCDRSVITDASTWLRTLQAKQRAASREVHVDQEYDKVSASSPALGGLSAARLLEHQEAAAGLADTKELLTAFVNMLRRPVGQLRGSVADRSEGISLAAQPTIPTLGITCPARKLICGIDDADRLGGVTLKLLAIEQLLQRVPRLRDRIALLQVVAHSSTDKNSSQARALEARSIARRINAQFGRGPGGPVVFLLERLGRPNLENRLALWASCDVWLSTRIRCGLSLDPFEFTLARTKPAGVVVVSEFDAASRVLGGSLRVNPFRSEEVVAALDLALSMGKDEAAARHAVSERFVLTCTTSMWAKRVLLDLKRAQQRVQGIDFQSYGLGLGFRVMGFGENFKSLRIDSVVQAYRKARRRLILTDFGGTLPTQDPDTQPRGMRLVAGAGRGPGAALVHGRDRALPLSGDTQESLRALAQDRRNTVMVLSGRDRRVMSSIFRDLPEVGLAAEHGFVFQLGDAKAQSSGRTDGHGSRKWQQLLQQFDESWLDVTGRVMELYAARTNGAYVSRKPSAVAWNFGRSDKDFGSMQAKEMTDHLLGVLGGAPVEVVTGHDSVEVRPRGVNKGAVAWRLMDIAEGIQVPVPDTDGTERIDAQKPLPAEGSHRAATRPSSENRVLRANSGGSVLSAASSGAAGALKAGFDFVLAIGDDAADELLFNAITQRTAQRVTMAAAARGMTAESRAHHTADATPKHFRSQESDERVVADGAASVASNTSSLARSSDHGSDFGPSGASGLGRQSRAGSSFSALSQPAQQPSVTPVASPGHANQAVSSETTYVAPTVFTVTVGKKPSAAGYFVDDPMAVEELFRGLARSTAKSRVHHSMIDLRSMGQAPAWSGRRWGGELPVKSGAPPSGASGAVGIERGNLSAEQGPGISQPRSPEVAEGHPPVLDGEMGWDAVAADGGWSSTSPGLRAAVSMPTLTGDVKMHYDGIDVSAWTRFQEPSSHNSSASSAGTRLGAASGDGMPGPGCSPVMVEAPTVGAGADTRGARGGRASRISRQPISGNMVDYFAQIEQQDDPLGF